MRHGNAHSGKETSSSLFHRHPHAAHETKVMTCIISQLAVKQSVKKVVSFSYFHGESQGAVSTIIYCVCQPRRKRQERFKQYGWMCGCLHAFPVSLSSEEPLNFPAQGFLALLLEGNTRRSIGRPSFLFHSLAFLDDSLAWTVFLVLWGIWAQGPTGRHICAA